MIWAQGEISLCRVSCRKGGALGEDGDPPDGFPPFFSLLRLMLPYRSLMPTPWAIPAGGAQVSHTVPGTAPSPSRRPGTPPAVCVNVQIASREPRVAFLS